MTDDRGVIAPEKSVSRSSGNWRHFAPARGAERAGRVSSQAALVATLMASPVVAPFATRVAARVATLVSARVTARVTAWVTALVSARVSARVSALVAAPVATLMPALMAGLLMSGPASLAAADTSASENSGGLSVEETVAEADEEGDVGAGDVAGEVAGDERGAKADDEAGEVAREEAGKEAGDGFDFTASVLEDGHYFEIGLAVAAGNANRVRLDPGENDDVVVEFGPFFAGAWRGGDYFLEGKRGGFDGLSLGATLWHDRRWVLDLLAIHASGSYSFEFDDDHDQDGTARRDKALLERISVFGSSGLRLRRYADASLVQLSAVVDWQNGHGALFGAHFGRQGQLGNWNTQFLIGARHASAALSDFIWGVDDAEATERFEAHRVSGTAFAEMEFGVSRAVGRKWILSSRLSARRFADSLVESPLVTRPGFVSFETAISYVF